MSTTAPTISLIREFTEGERDGWRTLTPTGKTRASCTCGMDTGPVPERAAQWAAYGHAEAHFPGMWPTPEEPK